MSEIVERVRDAHRRQAQVWLVRAERHAMLGHDEMAERANEMRLHHLEMAGDYVETFCDVVGCGCRD